jgi:hypothetical protein
MMKKAAQTLLAICFVVAGASAARAGAPVQNHHCKMPDGTMDMAKTKNECKAAKGKWTKDAPAADAAKAEPAKAEPAAEPKK